MESTTRVIQAIGLTSSIFLAGANIGASHLTVPLLYQQPISINTAFFKDFYIRASKVELEKANKEEVVELLKRWRWMNIVRGSLALVGGLTAVWAVMSE
ncbi:hypothetical protein Neosp_007283 [[Neocosmospora] mangrovei]